MSEDKQYSADEQAMIDEGALYKAIETYFSDRIKSDKEFCHRLWSSLTNIDWIVPGSHRATGMSFRQAANFIARTRNEVDESSPSGYNYYKYYLQSPESQVDAEIAGIMKEGGWDYRNAI
jgi:hypothetical protein